MNDGEFINYSEVNFRLRFPAMSYQRQIYTDKGLRANLKLTTGLVYQTYKLRFRYN